MKYEAIATKAELELSRQFQFYTKLLMRRKKEGWVILVVIQPQHSLVLHTPTPSYNLAVCLHLLAYQEIYS